MEKFTPDRPELLARTLSEAIAAGRCVSAGGASSKLRMGGAAQPAEVEISTAHLDRVLQYEPNDLTVSVEAGMPWAEFCRLLASNRQMAPLDPPFAAQASVGGVIATNSSGPRRRLYGTARDMVIGMKFATPDGRIVQSGGMVVKNVAGLDMGKLMIGSFGTLAVLLSVNFRLFPKPARTRTFAVGFADAAAASKALRALLASVLQPAAVDLLNPAAAAMLGRHGFVLLMQAGGSAAVVDRYSRETGPGGIWKRACGKEPESLSTLEGEQEAALWDAVCEFVPRFLAASPQGAVARLSCPLTEVCAALESAPGPALARAGSGVVYAVFPEAASGAAWVAGAASSGWRGVVEFGPAVPAAQSASGAEAVERWPAPGGELELMREIKRMFDPNHLLNRGRLYGRI